MILISNAIVNAPCDTHLHHLVTGAQAAAGSSTSSTQPNNDDSVTEPESDDGVVPEDEDSVTESESETEMFEELSAVRYLLCPLSFTNCRNTESWKTNLA
jgi:hypothetical protein